jgi:predicted transcriptional regulator
MSRYDKSGSAAALELPLRSEIFNLVKAQGGITYTEIKRKLEITGNGGLAYNLRVLEKNRLLRSFSDGHYKRFYAKGQQVNELTTVEELILNMVIANPDSSKRFLAEKIDYSQGTINSTLKKLQQKELIGMKKIGKHYAYYAVDTAVDPTSPDTIDNRVGQDS